MGAQDEVGRSGGPNGFVAAHPWRDLTLVNLMLSFPPELNFDPRFDRPLAREAVRGLIPESVRLSLEKPFFNALLDDAFAGPDRLGLDELLRTLPEAVSWAVAPNGLNHPSGRIRSLLQWRVATLAIWANSQISGA
jgi:hypothetical protein